jgi:hypothetical protein
VAHGKRIKNEYIKKRGSQAISTTPLSGTARRAASGHSGTLDDRDSMVQRVQVQRTSISSRVRSALYPDPSRSNSSSSFVKYDKTVVSTNQFPHWTLLTAAASTRPSVSSRDPDGDSITGRGGTSSTPPVSGHVPGQPNPEGLLAHLASPSVARQPPPDKQPHGPDHPPVLAQGHRPPN